MPCCQSDMSLHTSQVGDEKRKCRQQLQKIHENKEVHQTDSNERACPQFVLSCYFFHIFPVKLCKKRVPEQDKPPTGFTCSGTTRCSLLTTAKIEKNRETSRTKDLETIGKICKIVCTVSQSQI